jgi:hypothetical protein
MNNQAEEALVQSTTAERWKALLDGLAQTSKRFNFARYRLFRIAVKLMMDNAVRSEGNVAWYFADGSGIVGEEFLVRGPALRRKSRKNGMAN